MLKAPVASRDLRVAGGPPAPTAEEIRRQLQNILTSPTFHGSKRCQQFLEYACEKALAGEAGALKERMIAIEVFGRQPQTDLGEDTIVRVGAREVRKRLAQYYVTPDGKAAEVRIDLPPGSYAPEFRYAGALHEDAPPAPAPAVAVVIPSKTRSRRWRTIATYSSIVLAIVAAIAIVRLSSAGPNTEAFQRFWNPVFRAPGPLLLAVAHPIVYHPSGRALKLNEEGNPPPEVPLQRPIHLPPSALNGADMVPVFNQYVGFGDLVAATEVSSMLARRSKSVRVRLASGIEFADLMRAQTLLIGAVTNRWTMELQKGWRFRFHWTPGSFAVIADTQGGRQWSIASNDDGSSPEDYVLIGRIRDPSTGGLTLTAAGLKQFGTEAAGRLLADPEQLGPILQKLPPWESKNLQVVLHVQVVGNTPAQPEVVAWHVW